MSQWAVLIVWQFRPTSRPGSSRSMLKRQKRHLVPWTAVRGDVDIEWYRYTAVPSYPVDFALVRIVGEVWYSCPARNDDWHQTFGSWIIPEKYEVGPWTHGISHGKCVLVVGLQKSYIINIYIYIYIHSHVDETLKTWGKSRSIDRYAKFSSFLLGVVSCRRTFFGGQTESHSVSPK